MTTDVFSTLQAFPNAQALQPINQQMPSDGEASLSGLFAALMNECIAEGEAADFSAQTLVLPEENSELQAMTFTGNNSFPQSVINILAGEPEILPESEPPENMPLTENKMPSPETADDDTVIWPEDEVITKTPKAPETPDAPKIPDAPEFSGDPEPECAENILREIPELEHADYIPLKVQDAPAKTVKAPDEPEDSDDKKESPEIPEGSAELAGLAGVMTPQPKTSGHTEIQDSQTQPQNSHAASQPVRQRRAQPETHEVPREQQKTSESQEVRSDIQVNREAFSEPEDEGNSDAQQQNQNPQNQNQNHTQTQTQSRKSEIRSSKTESVSQKPDTEIRRTESHSDFGAYFEGVLNSRRTTARTSQPMPLNLRSAENFTQASALRDGITNVVRFIRADGVQKARVIVDPPALGRVSVELTNGTSGVEASIKVASEQIRQLVQDQISQLRMNLSQQGVQVAEFTVDVQQDSSGNHNQQGQEQYAGRFGFVDDSDDDEAEDFRIDLNEGLLYWVA